MVTLMLMVLLTIIAVGFLSLSTISLRQSSANAEMAVARANAQLAMILAVGELQLLAGPDKRVTATASLLEGTTAAATPVANRHWTGVWRTDRYKGETAANPILRRNASASGPDAFSMIDRRADGSYDKANQALGWLASNPNPSTDLDPRIALTGESITLVDSGTLGPLAAATEKVSVPMVPLQQDGRRVGSYGWWVGDEGVKARLDLAPGDPSQAKFKSLSADHFGISAISTLGNYENIPADQLPLVISRGSGELAGSAAVPQDALRAAFHSVTASSSGVLADTLNGGLRRDLTAFLATGSLPAFGTARSEVNLDTPLLDATNLSSISARMGLFKNWNDLGVTAGAARELGVIPPPKANGVEQYIVEKENLNVISPGPAIANYQTADIHPVLVDASLSYGLSVKQDSGNPEYYQVFVHIYPHFVLWNPYNAKLGASAYAIQLGLPTEFQPNIYKNGTTNREGYYVKSGSSFNANGARNFYTWIQEAPYQFSGNNPSNPLGAPTFYIPSTAFEPGESLLFTADATAASDQSVRWTADGNLGSFALSCTVPGSEIPKNSFVIETNRYVNIPAGTPLTACRYNLNWEVWNGHLTNNQFSRLWQVDSPSIRPVDVPNVATPLQYINLAEDGVYQSDIAYSNQVNLVSKQRPLELLNNPGARYPLPWLKWGTRLQWFQETDANASPGTTLGSGGPAFAALFLDHNLFASNNLRANWHVRSPVENAFRIHRSSGSNYARFVHGTYIDDMLGWDWTDPGLNPPSFNGKNRVSPFGRPGLFGASTYPIFEIPQEDIPIMSLGAFQHLPLSNFYWHPSYAVGNGNADPRVTRNHTTNFISASQWQNLGLHGPTDRWNRIRQNIHDQSFLYDLSYEANQALWDRYFLSTIPRTFSAGDTIPNSRMVPLTSEPASVASLLDGNKSASHLMLNGAFNINSTSEDAWTAWLGSMRENPAMEIFFNDGASTTANNVFSRLLWPHNQEYQQDDPFSQPTWSGYRKLSDDEIRALAKEIVVEVKRRGPFISLADFVNRRLVNPPATSGSETELSATGLKGTLQAAIDRTKDNGQRINGKLDEVFTIAKTEYQAKTIVNEQWTYGANYPDLLWRPLTAYIGVKPDHNHYTDSKLTGAPGFLTQADLLQKFGSTISARSDTFVIRSYGETRAKDGVTVTAQAWCEAVVQRVPQPIQPDPATNNLDPISTDAADFGRRFEIISFRWLNSGEI